MQLPLQDFTALVRTQAAAAALGCRTLLDMSVGSVLRAVIEANASVGLWVQWLIMEVLATTRAATSQGADLDSWVGDFGLLRLPAVAASGSARFSRATPGLAATVPVGAILRTGVLASDQAFQVIADPSQASWTGAGYAIPATATELVAPIQAVMPGRAGNVQAGLLTLLSTAIPGVDAVVNDFPATGGLDAETDLALRTRFGGFIDSRTRATSQAITFAIQSVQQGLQFVILERMDTQGGLLAGHFTVVVDDGSGAPSAALLGQVGAAIEAVRPVGGTYSVRPPQMMVANVALTAEGPAGVGPVVQAAIGAFIQQLPIGTGIVLSRLVQVAHDADVRVQRVSNVSVNGTTSDFGVPVFGRAAPGLVTLLP
jgi:hypothetical protein